MNETTPFAPVPVLTGEKMAATRKLRPKGLGLLLLGSAGLHVIWWFLPHLPSKFPVVSSILGVFALAIDVCLYISLWKGRNWARIVTIIFCAIEMLSLFTIHKYATSAQVYIVVHVMYSTYLIYWLTRKPVVAFFKAPGNATSKPHEVVADSNVT